MNFNSLEIDKGIRQLIIDLNNHNYPTLFCCEGIAIGEPANRHDLLGYIYFKDKLPFDKIRKLKENGITVDDSSWNKDKGDCIRAKAVIVNGLPIWNAKKIFVCKCEGWWDYSISRKQYNQQRLNNVEFRKIVREVLL